MPPEGQQIVDVSHIYLICRRPALSFDPAAFNYEPEGISTGRLIRKIDGTAEAIDFSAAIRNPGGGEVTVDGYPHRKLVGYDEQGEAYATWPASMLAFGAELADRTINDFKVEYVGQAFAEGKRTAWDRLKSHSTLQKILADINSRLPDDEVMLFLFEYMPATAHIYMDGIAKDAEVTGEEDLEHLRSVIDNPLTQAEEISIAEAGLIWYFRPEYNIKLKDAEPNAKLKLLESCYNLDFAGLVVEINTDEFPVRTFSNTAKPGHHHVARFDLHDPEKRRTFFSFVDDKGQMTLMRQSGPSY